MTDVAIPFAATATLAGTTREVAINHLAVRSHMTEAGLTQDQAVAMEAVLTLGALLVEERCDEMGPEFGNALALRLEGEMMTALAAVTA